MVARVDDTKCTACGVCIDFCPVRAIKIENEKAVISKECIDCGACESQCPNEAISVRNST